MYLLVQLEHFCNIPLRFVLLVSCVLCCCCCRGLVGGFRGLEPLLLFSGEEESENTVVTIGTWILFTFLSFPNLIIR